MFSTGGLSIDQAPPLHLPVRFFATAPLFMLFAGLTSIYFAEDLLLTPLMPETVAFAHLAVLGWVLMIMFGAMYQMIPVLAGLPVPKPGLVPWVHGLLVMGVITMALGIATDIHPWLLLFASLGLGGSIALFVIPVGIALFKAPAKHPTVTAMRISLISLVGVLAMGAIFLGEYSHGFYDFNREALVAVHLTWGLFGWVGTLIMGVSFQVLPMFYMTPEFPKKTAFQILIAWSLSLIFLPLVLFYHPENSTLLWASALPGLLALLLYGVNMKTMLSQRKRVLVDLTYRFWLLGFASATVALILFALWPGVEDDNIRLLFGIFYIIGWATSILLGMLYKIVPFIIWFHRFSKLAGLVKIPMMDNLLPQKAVTLHFPIHIVTVLAYFLAIIIESPLLTMFAGGCLIVSGGILAYGIWFALSIEPPQAPEIPDFESFFKDMEIPPPAKQTDK
ncbi:MAG: hypothetical protein HQL69_00855 [Magnetococcales bacterium]|nr:hypothetical protein [Magnetococcales bacterium]